MTSTGHTNNYYLLYNYTVFTGTVIDNACKKGANCVILNTVTITVYLGYFSHHGRNTSRLYYTDMIYLENVF